MTRKAMAWLNGNWQPFLIMLAIAMMAVGAGVASALCESVGCQ